MIRPLRAQLATQRDRAVEIRQAAAGRPHRQQAGVLEAASAGDHQGDRRRCCARRSSSTTASVPRRSPSSGCSPSADKNRKKKTAPGTPAILRPRRFPQASPSSFASSPLRGTCRHVPLSFVAQDPSPSPLGAPYVPGYEAYLEIWPVVPRYGPYPGDMSRLAGWIDALQPLILLSRRFDRHPWGRGLPHEVDLFRRQIVGLAHQVRQLHFEPPDFASLSAKDAMVRTCSSRRFLRAAADRGFSSPGLGGPLR